MTALYVLAGVAYVIFGIATSVFLRAGERHEEGDFWVAVAWPVVWVLLAGLALGNWFRRKAGES